MTISRIWRAFGLQFLDLIETQVPAGLDVHLIVDNYSTHKTAIIRNWFAKRPHFHVHFTPTYGSWINLVERWFAELTNKRIWRGVFRYREGSGIGNSRVH
jgi:transposase